MSLYFKSTLESKPVADTKVGRIWIASSSFFERDYIEKLMIDCFLNSGIIRMYVYCIYFVSALVWNKIHFLQPITENKNA